MKTIKQNNFIGTAWNNGLKKESGAGYGLKISRENRDQFFTRHKPVMLKLISAKGTSQAMANIDKDSFWNGACQELISKDIGVWFIRNCFAPWCKGLPPRFQIVPISENEFEVRPVANQ